MLDRCKYNDMTRKQELLVQVIVPVLMPIYFTVAICIVQIFVTKKTFA